MEGLGDALAKVPGWAWLIALVLGAVVWRLLTSRGDGGVLFGDDGSSDDGGDGSGD